MFLMVIEGAGGMAWNDTTQTLTFRQNVFLSSNHMIALATSDLLQLRVLVVELVFVRGWYAIALVHGCGFLVPW